MKYYEDFKQQSTANVAWIAFILSHMKVFNYILIKKSCYYRFLSKFLKLNFKLQTYKFNFVFTLAGIFGENIS